MAVLFGRGTAGLCEGNGASYAAHQDFKTLKSDTELITDKELVVGLGGLIGGLFIGFVLYFIAFFVFQFSKEAIEKPKERAFAAIVLFAIFGSGLFFGIDRVASSGWPVIIGALIACALAFKFRK